MTEYQIKISSKSKKDLRRIDRQLRNKLVDKILQLKTKRKLQQYKALIGFKIARYRIRVGDYRILFDVNNQDKTVIIIRIGHRKDIYRLRS